MVRVVRLLLQVGIPNSVTYTSITLDSIEQQARGQAAVAALDDSFGPFGAQ